MTTLKHHHFTILSVLIIIAAASLFVGCDQPDLPPEPGVPGEQVTSDGGDGSVGAAFLQAYADLGYAPPYNVFNGDLPITEIVPNEFTLGYTMNDVGVQVNTHHDQGLVYYKAYYFDANDVPNEILLAPSGQGYYNSNWYQGAQSVNIPLSRDELNEGENFIFTYTCEKIDDQWKCGCTAADECNRWRISEYNATLISDPLSPSAPTELPESVSYVVAPEPVVSSRAVEEDFVLDPTEDHIGVSATLPYSGSFVYGTGYYYTQDAGWVSAPVTGSGAINGDSVSSSTWFDLNQEIGFDISRDGVMDGTNHFVFYRCDLSVNDEWSCNWNSRTYDVTVATLPQDPDAPETEAQLCSNLVDDGAGNQNSVYVEFVTNDGTGGYIEWADYMTDFSEPYVSRAASGVRINGNAANADVSWSTTFTADSDYTYYFWWGQDQLDDSGDGLSSTLLGDVIADQKEIITLPAQGQTSGNNPLSYPFQSTHASYQITNNGGDSYTIVYSSTPFVSFQGPTSSEKYMVVKGIYREVPALCYNNNNVVVNEACSDGVDNDANGFVDLADPACSNSEDNDESGFTDVCGDGIDNDGDGLIDLQDPGCTGQLTDVESSATTQCQDGIDNDNDGLIDLNDDGCDDAVDDNEFFIPLNVVFDLDDNEVFDNNDFTILERWAQGNSYSTWLNELTLVDARRSNSLHIRDYLDYLGGISIGRFDVDGNGNVDLVDAQLVRRVGEGYSGDIGDIVVDPAATRTDSQEIINFVSQPLFNSGCVDNPPEGISYVATKRTSLCIYYLPHAEDKKIYASTSSGMAFCQSLGKGYYGLGEYLATGANLPLSTTPAWTTTNSNGYMLGVICYP